jgi:hypothetical protein
VTIKSNLTLAYWLSSALFVVTLIGTIGSLMIPGIFRRDQPVFAGNAQGTLFIILVVTLPILIASMFLAARGSMRALIAWIATVGQIFYNSVYLTFDTNFNRLFFIYVAMLSLSFWSLLVLLRQDVEVCDLCLPIILDFDYRTGWCGVYGIPCSACRYEWDYHFVQLVAHHRAFADAKAFETRHNNRGFLQAGISGKAQPSIADCDNGDRFRHFSVISMAFVSH